ncbi:MAG TPA: DUF4349 domain-containing protein [Blastocatellia bacterium]|nr:DUF4349 domain-containing protein [Blastocatellia bacterium]
MKQRVKKGIIYLVVGFVVLFCLRLGYGYLAPAQIDAGTALNEGLATTIGGRTAGFSKDNYASEKLKIAKGDSQAYSIDQKYEKVASVFSTTRAFDEDEKRVRGLTTKHNALIQFEQSSGLSGSKRVNLAIGVPPDHFDPMVSELKEIGELASIRIDKTDKTNEYKELKAKRLSLEKTRDALAALKSKGGQIEEFTNLENRILEIEEEIQTTGVKLGDYDAENEFCTVRLTLEEKGAARAGISFLHRVRVALAWTIRYYLMALGLLFFGTLFVLVAVVLLQRLNLIPPAAGQSRPEAAG